jgi:hypothetical protein
MNALVRLARANGQYASLHVGFGSPAVVCGLTRAFVAAAGLLRRAVAPTGSCIPGGPDWPGGPASPMGPCGPGGPGSPFGPGGPALPQPATHANMTIAAAILMIAWTLFFSDRSVRQARQSAERVSVANGPVTARTPFQDCRFEPNALTNRPRRCRSAEAPTATRHL